MLHQKYLNGGANKKCISQPKGKNKNAKCKHLIVL